MILRVLLALLVLSLTSDALAFCRQRTCDPSITGEDCDFDEETGCFSEGGVLYYDSPCLSFSVGSGSGELLGLTDAEFEDVVAEAFFRWENADCGDGLRPNLRVQSVGVIDSSEGFFCNTQPTLNTSLWFLNDDWSDNDPRSLGFTTSTFAVTESAPNFGEIFDADVELNVEKVEREFPFARRRQVLLSIATHEAGHFLGLSHSNDSSAVMAASYSDRDLLTRQLTQDDEDAVCEIYGAVAASDVSECSLPGISEAAFDAAACEAAGRQLEEPGCAVRRPGQSRSNGLWFAWGVAALALLVSRRRKACATCS